MEDVDAKLLNAQIIKKKKICSKFHYFFLLKIQTKETKKEKSGF